MPSQSKSQQQLMGMAYALKKGELDTSGLDAKFIKQLKDIGDGMTDKELKAFAKTKHDGLPDKKVEEGFEAMYESIVVNEIKFALKDIRVLTNKWKLSNGMKSPKGTGQWGFLIGDKEYWYPNTSYKRATMDAKREAQKQGLTVVEVLP